MDRRENGNQDYRNMTAIRIFWCRPKTLVKLATHVGSYNSVPDKMLFATKLSVLPCCLSLPRFCFHMSSGIWSVKPGAMLLIDINAVSAVSRHIRGGAFIRSLAITHLSYLFQSTAISQECLVLSLKLSILRPSRERRP